MIKGLRKGQERPQVSSMGTLEGKKKHFKRESVDVRSEAAMLDFVLDERNGMSTFETYGKFYHEPSKSGPIK